MKKLLLSLLIPCSVFACQCREVLEIQKDLIQEQIQRIDDSYIHDEEILIYLHGQYDGIEQAIFLLDVTGNCP